MNSSLRRDLNARPTPSPLPDGKMFLSMGALNGSRSIPLGKAGNPLSKRLRESRSTPELRRQKIQKQNAVAGNSGFANPLFSKLSNPGRELGRLMSYHHPDFSYSEKSFRLRPHYLNFRLCGFIKH